jgi:acetyltransferase-like isoleucine patch superfamily enzyme
VKTFLKAAADLAAALIVLPAVLAYRVGRAAFGADKAFPGWSQAFALIPGLSGAYLRRAFYRRVLSRCEPGCCLSFGTVFSHPTAEVGRDVYVGVYGCLGAVTLEDDVLLGSHVSVINGGGQHGIERLDIPIREQPGTFPRVTIGRDTWIGDRSIVLADVGQHCVVGAGSVVTRPIPDYAIAVGVPARVIRFRDRGPEADEPGTAEAGVRRSPRPEASSPV